MLFNISSVFLMNVKFRLSIFPLKYPKILSFCDLSLSEVIPLFISQR